MVSVARIGTAIALILAFATAPLLADRCAALCDSGRQTTASNAAPPCHHGASTGFRIGQTPSNCGHDHSRIVLVTATNLPDSAASSAPSISNPSGPAVLTHAAANLGRPALDPSRRDSTATIVSFPLALAFALRI
jgi:hypothetical protein